MHRRRFLTTAAGVAGLAGCITWRRGPSLGGRSKEEVKADAEEVPYDDLYRKVDEYEGEAIYDSGYVYQLMDVEENYSNMLISVGKTGLVEDKLMWAYWNGPPFRENDDIEFWAIVAGIKTYNTMLGGEKTVPEIDIVDMQLQSQADKSGGSETASGDAETPTEERPKNRTIRAYG